MKYCSDFQTLRRGTLVCRVRSLAVENDPILPNWAEN